MEPPMRGTSREDYLEAILMITEESGDCHAVDVARLLGFSRPSVTIAMKKLAGDGLVEKNDENHLVLTPEGQAIAEKTLTCHRLLASLLVRLGVSPETAEKDACAMEHQLSDETIAALQKAEGRLF